MRVVLLSVSASVSVRVRLPSTIDRAAGGLGRAVVGDEDVLPLVSRLRRLSLQCTLSASSLQLVDEMGGVCCPGSKRSQPR